MMDPYDDLTLSMNLKTDDIGIRSLCMILVHFFHVTLDPGKDLWDSQWCSIVG